MTDEKIRILPLIADDASIEPSSEGVDLIEYYFPDDCERLMLLARSGAHMQNPYHNLHHELSCVYWAHACAMNSTVPVVDTSLPTLVLAALFHDHNHSGGRSSDLENIRRAIAFVSCHLQDSVSSSALERMSDIIRCTEFTNGTFPHEPISFPEQCMRDADLMTIYSSEGRQLLIGLGVEMGFNFVDDHDKYLEGQRKFLTGARMYTEYGKYMQSTFLDDCLVSLGDEIADRLDEGLCQQ